MSSLTHCRTSVCLVLHCYKDLGRLKNLHLLLFHGVRTSGPEVPECAAPSVQLKDRLYLFICITYLKSKLCLEKRRAYCLLEGEEMGWRCRRCYSISFKITQENKFPFCFKLINEDILSAAMPMWRFEQPVSCLLCCSQARVWHHNAKNAKKSAADNPKCHLTE